MLTGVLRKKIWSDLFDNLGRTAQVVIIIAIGSIAVGSIVGSLELIQQDITANWMLSNPASIGLALGDKGVDQDMIDAIARFKEVDQAEGQLNEGIKWRRSPADPWQPATLRARDDYQDMKLYTLHLEDGEWPHAKVMTVNRGYQLATGDQVHIFVNNSEKTLDIGGVTRYQNAPPPNFGGNPDFFVTKEYFAELTGFKTYRYVTASVPGEYTAEKAIAAAQRIEDQIEGEDVEVYPGTNDGTKVIFPGKHPAQDPINGVFFILQVMAFAALILGLFLVYNTITAIISRQIPQIGVLKAIGATRGQILRLYYTIVLIYGLLAMVISIPLGAIAGHGLRVWMIEFMTMDPGPFAFSLRAVLVQAAICLLSPTLISTQPIMRGAGITVREAISNYGLTGGGGWLDNLLGQLAFIPRMTSMAVSNTFRNKTRVFMTQITLVGAGILFMAVLSAQSSVSYTYGPILFETLKASVLLTFEKSQRVEKVAHLIEFDQPPVSQVEMWAPVSGQMRPTNQPEAFDDRNVVVTGMPIPTGIYGPRVRAGRWLLPEDTFAVVITQKEAGKIGVGVGDWVTLDIPTKRKTDWLVVGLVADPIDARRIIAPQESLLLADQRVGQANDLFIKTIVDTPAYNEALAAPLRQNFEAPGLDLTARTSDTILLLSEEIISSFNIIIYLFLIMAILIAIVGGIALSGVLSINVMERRVEIGILRAIGASNAAIATLFITEGMLLGWLSWLIAVPLSIPFSMGLNAAVGLAVQAELSFEYALTSVWIWLVIITVLAVVASWLPARGAIQVSVRERLSYE
jgi:putative ABC transport system permease protein